MTKEGTDFSNLGYSISLTTEEYAAGFRKGSDLTAEVNRILAELKQTEQWTSFLKSTVLTLLNKALIF